MSFDRNQLAMPDRALPDRTMPFIDLPLAPTDFRKPIIAGLAVIGIAFGGFGTWAALAPLDSAVVAQGMVVVESKRKTVQHREGGIVSQLLVKEGDTVQAGAVLARLQDAGAEAQMGNLMAQLDAKLAEQARLMAERDGLAAIALPADLEARRAEPKLAEILARQQDRFDERRKTLQNQVDILEARISQLESQKEGKVKLEDSKAEQLQLLKDEIEGLRSLTAKGYFPLNKLRASERELARMEGELGHDGAATSQLDKEIGETRLQIIQARQKAKDEAVAELAKVENEVNDLGAKLVTARDAVERLVVVAPVTGVVQSLKIAGQGAVVSPGGEVAEIVPDGDRLVVDAHVNPQDIDRVHEEQTAHLRFSTFASKSTPTIEGEVSVISADRITERDTKQSFYTARVEVPEDQLARLPRHLKAGMPVEVMLEGGERTALQYMVKPLLDSFARSFKER